MHTKSPRSKERGLQTVEIVSALSTESVGAAIGRPLFILHIYSYSYEKREYTFCFRSQNTASPRRPMAAPTRSPENFRFLDTLKREALWASLLLRCMSVDGTRYTLESILSSQNRGSVHRTLPFYCSSPFSMAPKKRGPVGLSFLVPLTGLEPVQCRHRGILSPLCLPIPPQRRLCLY